MNNAALGAFIASYGVTALIVINGERVSDSVLYFPSFMAIVIGLAMALRQLNEWLS